jgi:hypothetical protein
MARFIHDSRVLVPPPKGRHASEICQDWHQRLARSDEVMSGEAGEGEIREGETARQKWVGSLNHLMDGLGIYELRKEASKHLAKAKPLSRCPDVSYG